MNKKILAKLASLTAGVALLAGATFAAFTSNSVTITGVNLQSADPKLEIWDGASWETTAALGITETNIYPGWEGSERTFYLRNVSGGSVPFADIFASIVAGAIGDWDALKNVIDLRFGETGTGWSTDWHTLEEWFTGGGGAGADDLLLSNLNDATQRQFSLQFRMDSGAGDAAKNKNLTFTLSFVAQTP